MAFTWTEILDDIKVRSAMPTSQSTYTAARFLNLANAVMRSRIVPFVNSVRENYYSYDVDWTIVANSSILIPSRAVGGKLENVSFLNGTERGDAPRYYEDELRDLSMAPSVKAGFYLKRNRLFVLPSDGGGWTTLRMAIVIRPNTIVDPTTDAAQITAINTGTKTLTFASCPSTWTTASIFDLVQANPHFDWLAIDQAISAITATTATFSSTLPTDLAVGDWISLAGYSPIIQCPAEVHPLLAQEVANVCLKAQGIEAAYKLGLEEAKMIREEVVSLLSPRVEEAGRKLVNNTGLLRRRM